MADVFDVGAYILRELGSPVSRHKLHKLLYYAQAWSLTLRGEPLFAEPVEAWREGPVVRRLYESHPGEKAPLESLPRGNADVLSPAQRDVVQAVLAVYGEEDAETLIDRTHHEKPWRQARRGLPESAPSNEEISLESMASFYARSRERRAIDTALEKLVHTRFLEMRSARSRSNVSPEMVEYARRSLEDRSRLVKEDPERWAQRMTDRLAGADD